MDEVGEWGFGYLLTVSDDSRTHLLALRPQVVGDVFLLPGDQGRIQHGIDRKVRVAPAQPGGRVVQAHHRHERQG